LLPGTINQICIFKNNLRKSFRRRLSRGFAEFERIRAGIPDEVGFMLPISVLAAQEGKTSYIGNPDFPTFVNV